MYIRIYDDNFFHDKTEKSLKTIIIMTFKKVNYLKKINWVKEKCRYLGWG